MGRKKGNIIGLELGRSVAKFVEYSPSEKEVKTIAILLIESSEWNDVTNLAEKIKNWILKYKMSQKQVEVISSVFGENSVIRTLSLPSNEPDVQDALQWEIEQYINSPIGEYSFDYQKMGAENDLYLLAAFRKSEIEKLLKIVDSPDLKLTVVDIDLFAVQNVFEKNYPKYFYQQPLHKF